MSKLDENELFRRVLDGDQEAEKELRRRNRRKRDRHEQGVR